MSARSLDRPQLGALALGALLTACGDTTTVSTDHSDATSGSSDTGETPLDLGDGTTGTDTGTETGPEPHASIRALVLLDGAPVEGAVVMQGGIPTQHLTDAEGFVDVLIDYEVGGPILIASDHDARTRAAEVPGGELAPEVTIELTTIAAGDNEAYVFDPPGVPGVIGTTAQCGHCHQSQVGDWYQSPHRAAASNPAVHDLYAGVATAFDWQDCVNAGGDWWIGVEPGTGSPQNRCYVGHGALPDLNQSCGDTEPCDVLAQDFGGCADCHAPGINGSLGGRDLLEARGTEHEDGIHCDVCHKIESVDVSAEAPGVAGRLIIKRPVEPSPSRALGLWSPLMFGPYRDVPNPRMGSVAREHFSSADLCGGCHQLDQEVLLPGEAIDLTRWPGGRLPIHSTYEEWLDSPANPASPCHGCHMPADYDEINAADYGDNSFPGIAFGWPRLPGTVRQHSFVGPRQPELGIFNKGIEVSIDQAVANAQLTALVTVHNTGVGHAIPTGDPLRSMLVYVEARCDGAPLTSIGGDAIPDFGGWRDRQPSPGDWSIWPGAQVGEVVRVVTISGEWRDYTGFGVFGDGSLDPSQKGMLVETVVGASVITAVNGDSVSFDQPLPLGDLAYRGDPDIFVEAPDGAARHVAGAPGFAFARVLVDPEGERMAPHFRAVDVASDNRVLAGESASSTHVFACPCDQPTVRAVLVHRPYPAAIARERGWAFSETIVIDEQG